MRPVLVGIFGPTASGKTALAEAVADRLGARLINADAFQAYRGFDIGTAKPERRDRYDLLDIKEPQESYGVGEFVERAHAILQEAFASGQSAVAVGGTGLYLRALFEEYDAMRSEPPPGLRERLQARLDQEGLDSLVAELVGRAPQAAGEVDLRNPVRVLRALERLETEPLPVRPLPPFRRAKVGIWTETNVLNERIARRATYMVQNGWIEEVSSILQSGVREDAPAMRAIGYRDLVRVLDGRATVEEALDQLIVETRRYAKRQRSWMRSEPRLLSLDGSLELSGQLQAIGDLLDGQSD